MDAKAKAVREILHSGDQFIVPFFQRFYSWHRQNWERLKSDLEALIDDPARKQHFLGPLVCAALKPAPGEIHSFQLIDGQQRITTISVLLAALRDIALDQKDDELAAEITETFLIHRFKKGWQQFKLVPRTGDREAFAAIIRREPLDSFAALRLVEAYHFFRKTIRHQIHSNPERLREVFQTTVSRLYLVVITIGEENPYEIFESLNSTGLPLDESDLVRNFVFMQLPTEQQDDFHEQRWQPYEKLFDASGEFPQIPITPFYRDFLMRNGTFSRPKTTFVDFKQYYETAKWTPVAAVAELTRFAQYERSIVREGHGLRPVPAKALSRFNLVDAATAHPLLLNLLDRLQHAQLSEAEFSGCVQDVTSFVVRRTICGEQTGAYNRWFSEVIPHLGDKARQNLQAYLLRRGWPDDEAFEQQLQLFPIYRRDPKKCRLILEFIEESFGHKEVVNLKPLQIEHVMPQTIPAGKGGLPWRTMLGDEWRQAHERWLHTIGNLTLTGYNPNLSNKPYPDKRSELLNSKVTLNDWFSTRENWNAAAISERGAALAKIASKVLPRPVGVIYKQPAGGLVEKPKVALERRRAYWKQFIDLLETRKSPWLPLRVSDYALLPIPLPAYDVTLNAQFVPARKELVVRLDFSRTRGRVMYAALANDKATLDAEFAVPLQWIDGTYPQIRVAVPATSIRDPLDWLDQHEWIANRLAEFHRAFHARLAELHKLTKEAKPHGQFLFDYWCGFHDYLRSKLSFLTGGKPLPQQWLDFSIGRSGCFLQVTCVASEKRIAVHLVIAAKHGTEWFEQLKAEEVAIEGAVGGQLLWHAPPEQKQKHVILRKYGVDPTNREDWLNQFSWLHENLERFHAVFQPRIFAFESPGEEPVDSEADEE